MAVWARMRREAEEIVLDQAIDEFKRLAAEAHAGTSLGITRAHFLESAKQWHDKAQEAGYHPEVILAGRRINDGMGRYVADQVARLIAHLRAIVSAGLTPR